MTDRLAAWDKRYVWHPFTQQAEWAGRDPVIIESARGVWLRDTQGRRLLDGNASLWVNVWGHRRPELDRALNAQIGRIAHATFLGLSHAPAVRLAKALVDLAPQGLSRVFYSDNGSTAVEVALKMAYQYWQLKGRPKKTRFVSLREGYHGDTLGAVSVGGIDLFHQRFKHLIFSGWQVDPPLAPSFAAPAIRKPGPPAMWGAAGTRLTDCRDDDKKTIESVLRRHHRQIAAVVMEPLIQGASGMRLIERGYLKRVERLCRRYGVLLIVDEVATGFGRTGTMFAVEQEKVRPDFLCVAKSITGGYLPLAATLTSEAVYRAFLGRYDEFKTFFHGHTYTANPLACAVALENLALYKRRRLLANVRARAQQLRVGLRPLARHPHVKEIRQVGLMAGIELVADKKMGQAYRPASRMGLRVCDAALRRGLWLRPLGDVIVLLPPLAITAGELGQLIDGVSAAIVDATKKRI